MAMSTGAVDEARLEEFMGQIIQLFGRGSGTDLFAEVELH